MGTMMISGSATDSGEVGVLTAGSLAAALDEAIGALTALDAERLESIECEMLATVAAREQLSFLAADRAERERQVDEVRVRQHLLARLLESTSLNLQVLQRLGRRSCSGGDAWVR